jgi:hypothetical protein
MSVATRVSVGTTPTKIVGGTGTYSVQNKGSVIVELGGPAVAIGAGYELAATEKIQLTVGVGDDLYGIVAAATSPLQVLKLA